MSSIQSKTYFTSYIPEFDGLRALAILMVLFHNVGKLPDNDAIGLFQLIYQLVLNACWAGVQLFFVLSGFLITGILLESKGKKRHFTNFIARRSLRIFPIYFITLFFLFIIWPALLTMPQWLYDARAIQWGYWVYVINWLLPFGNVGGLSHLWSLAIEEQFYLLWPLIVFWFKPRSFMVFCLFLIISAPILRLLLILFSPTYGELGAYTFTFSRWDALAIGAILSIFIRISSVEKLVDRYNFHFVSINIILTIIILFLFQNFSATGTANTFLNQSIAAFLSVALVYICFSNRNEIDALHSGRYLFVTTFFLKVMRWQPLIRMGKISYSMYLFHEPIANLWYDSGFAWVVESGSGIKPIALDVLNIFVVSILTFLLANLSWYCVERHFLKLKRFFQ